MAIPAESIECLDKDTHKKKEKDAFCRPPGSDNNNALPMLKCLPQYKFISLATMSLATYILTIYVSTYIHTH